MEIVGHASEVSHEPGEVLVALTEGGELALGGAGGIMVSKRKLEGVGEFLHHEV